MQIKFADGTTLNVAPAALDAFLKHDLKWVEFVHGRAIFQQLPNTKLPVQAAKPISQSVSRCPNCAC